MQGKIICFRDLHWMYCYFGWTKKTPTLVICWFELHFSYSEGIKFQSAKEMDLCPVISCSCHVIHVIQPRIIFPFVFVYPVLSKMRRLIKWEPKTKHVVVFSRLVALELFKRGFRFDFLKGSTRLYPRDFLLFSRVIYFECLGKYVQMFHILLLTDLYSHQ